MVLKTYIKDTSPKEGDIKIVSHFAWLPRRVNNQLIWLEHYQEIYRWVTRERMLPYYEGMSKVYTLVCPTWDLVGYESLNNGITLIEQQSNQI